MTSTIASSCQLLVVAVAVLGCGGCRKDDEARVPLAELIYEDADAEANGGGQASASSAVAILNRRFTGPLAKMAHAERYSSQQIRVRVFGDDKDLIPQVRRRIEVVGMIEFRILANKHDHSSVIEEAKDARSWDVRDKGHSLIAEWIPVAVALEGIVSHDREVVTRVGQIRGDTVLFVLAMSDAYNMNGSYLQRAEAGVDEDGNRFMLLHWDEDGSRRLAGLTGANLPDQKHGITRKLGVILDKSLVAVVPIHATISNRMDVCGPFDEEGIDALVAILNGGSLPMQLRQVAE
jgi:preprotein translocase subunit SecD